MRELWRRLSEETVGMSEQEAVAHVAKALQVEEGWLLKLKREVDQDRIL